MIFGKASSPALRPGGRGFLDPNRGGTTSEKCEVAHTSPRLATSKIRVLGLVPGRCQEKPARFAFVFWMVVAMAAIILAITTRDLAAPSVSPIYHPQLVLVY